jgi:autotransporter-associated beta strand protein
MKISLRGGQDAFNASTLFRKATMITNRLATVVGAIALAVSWSFISQHVQAANWIGGDGGWDDIAGAQGWSTATPPNAIGDVASKTDGTSAVTTQNSFLGTITVGTINLGGADDIAWTVNGDGGVILDQDGAITSATATISNTNISTGTANALILGGATAITLNDDLLISNSGGSKNTTGAIQLAAPIIGSGNVTFRNEVTSTTGGATEGFIGLTSTGVNTFNGNILLQKGIVWISNNNSLGVGSNPVTLGDSSGGGQGSASLLVQASAVNAFANPITVTANAGGPLYLGTTTTGTPNVDSTIAIPSNGNLNLVSASTGLTGMALSGAISGDGSITVPTALPTAATNARVRLRSASSTYTGGTNVAGGVLILDANTDTNDPLTYTSGPAGKGDITLSGGTLSFVNTGTITVANPIKVTANSRILAQGNNAAAVGELTNEIHIDPGKTLTLSAGNTANVNVTLMIANKIVGDATTVLDMTQPNAGGNGAPNFKGSLSDFHGTMRFKTGNQVGATAGQSTNFPNHVTDGSTVRFEIDAAGGNQNIVGAQARFLRFGLNTDPNMPTSSLIKMGSLSGNGSINPQSGNNGTTSYLFTNYEVGHLNEDTVFSGQIFRRANSVFTKVGTGKLTLAGPNSYDGTTIVSAGTLIAGVDAVSTTVVLQTATMPAGDTVTMTNHGLKEGDLLVSTSAGSGSLTSTTNYRVHTVVDANSFKVALAATPNTIVTTTAAPTSLSFVEQGAFGTGTVPVQLGDANTAANNVSLLTGGAVTIERAVDVTSNGTGVATLGGDTDNNSLFSGAINLSKNVNISQVATTGANAVTFSGAISGGFGVSKVGDGKAVFSGANTYTGDTKVLAGTLSLTADALANSADVYLTSNSFLDLSFVGNDVIDSLFINGVAQAAGLWGGTGSGATHISNWITGTGLLSVTTGGATLDGDYNFDGKVDAADYVVWRKNPTMVGGGNPAGYNLWRQNFGNPPGSGSSLGSSAAVPEPAAAGLILSIVLGAFGGRWGRFNRAA